MCAQRSYFAQHVGSRNHHRHGSKYNDIDPPPPSDLNTAAARPVAVPAADSAPHPRAHTSKHFAPPQSRMPLPNDHSAFLGSVKPGGPAKPGGPPVLAGFYFRRRRERLNWRLLGSMDVDQIMKEVDIGALQEIVENLTFCDIDGEDLRYPDPNVVKLLQLAQLTIEYLLHSQQYLLDQRRSSSAQIEGLSSSLAHLRTEHTKQTAEVAGLKKETRVLRKSMYAYQLMTKIPGGIGQQTTQQPQHNPTAYH
ncbi:Zinc finger protein dzip1, partial [Thoreauomyces humboldtii]